MGALASFSPVGCAVLCAYPAAALAFHRLSRRSARAVGIALVLGSLECAAAAGPAIAGGVALSLALLVAVLDAMHAARGALAEQAITDPLTRAFNRRHLEACLAAAIERRARTGERASVLLFDVDHFKRINDAFGHAAGDALLQRLADLVARRARKIDALFRVGGEEFVLLLAGAGRAAAVGVADDLRTRIAAARLVDGVEVSISIGVSELRPAQSPTGWLAAADAALYRAKRTGRNRVATADGQDGFAAFGGETARTRLVEHASIR